MLIVLPSGLDHAQRCCQNDCQSGLITCSIGYFFGKSFSPCENRPFFRNCEIENACENENAEKSKKVKAPL